MFCSLSYLSTSDKPHNTLSFHLRSHFLPHSLQLGLEWISLEEEKKKLVIAETIQDHDQNVDAINDGRFIKIIIILIVIITIIYTHPRCFHIWEVASFIPGTANPPLTYGLPDSLNISSSSSLTTKQHVCHHMAKNDHLAIFGLMDII